MILTNNMLLIMKMIVKAPAAPSRRSTWPAAARGWTCGSRFSPIIMVIMIIMIMII